MGLNNKGSVCSHLTGKKKEKKNSPSDIFSVRKSPRPAKAKTETAMLQNLHINIYIIDMQVYIYKYIYICVYHTNDQ